MAASRGLTPSSFIYGERLGSASAESCVAASWRPGCQPFAYEATEAYRLEVWPSAEPVPGAGHKHPPIGFIKYGPSV